MRLEDHVVQMCLERSVTADTEANYRRSMRFYSLWLGEPATIDHLVESSVSQWLKSMEGLRAARTILGHKRAITALWNWLDEQRLVQPYQPKRLRRIPLNKVVPEAWTLENVRRLLAGAAGLSGRLRNGVAASDLMTAWILVGYESGLRPSDIRRLTRRSLQGDRLTCVQNKTNVVHSCTLSAAAVAAVEKIAVGDELFPASRNTIRRWEVRLFAWATQSDGFSRRRGQGLGTLRKTHGTEVCRVAGIEAAARSLGHVSGTQIAQSYYIAPDALPAPIAPPGISDATAYQSRRGDRCRHSRTGPERRRSAGLQPAATDHQSNRRLAHNRSG